MTVEERFDRMEHLTSGWIEQAPKDNEENRRLWREQQADIAALWKATDRRFEEMRREMAERDRETDRRFRETDERFRKTDERIDKLVSAIGELIQRLDRR